MGKNPRAYLRYSWGSIIVEGLVLIVLRQRLMKKTLKVLSERNCTWYICATSLAMLLVCAGHGMLRDSLSCLSWFSQSTCDYPVEVTKLNSNFEGRLFHSCITPSCASHRWKTIMMRIFRLSRYECAHCAELHFLWGKSTKHADFTGPFYEHFDPEMFWIPPQLDEKHNTIIVILRTHPCGCWHLRIVQAENYQFSSPHDARFYFLDFRWCPAHNDCGYRLSPKRMGFVGTSDN